MTTPCPEGTRRPAASPDAPGSHPSAIVRGEGRGTRGKTHEGAGAATDAPRAIIVELPLPPKECWPNRQRVHWRTRYDAQVTAGQWAMIAAISVVGFDAPHWERCRASILFRWPDARKRDLDGALGACKPYLDALAGVGIYRDDAGIVEMTLRAEIDRANPGVVITVWEVAE
jgi:hypothetical protein